MRAGFLTTEAAWTQWASVILVCQKFYGAHDAKPMLGGTDLEETKKVVQCAVDRCPVNVVELDMREDLLSFDCGRKYMLVDIAPRILSDCLSPTSFSCH
jgi:hypothetical protein